MEEEARRRVSRMQSANVTERKEPPPIEKPQEPENSDPLAGLFKDKEKLLILLLIMLLSQESDSTELVLALLYIII